MTDHQIFHVRQKSLYLHYAYDVALKKLGRETMKWIGDCCSETIFKMNEIGMSATMRPRTIANWNISFRKNGKFPHPNPNVANGVTKKPRIFEYFPLIEIECKEFAYANFDNFSVEMLKVELPCNIIPEHLN